MNSEVTTGSVLLLDCDTLTRVLTRAVLEQAGFSVREAASYEDAVELRSIMVPDLIVVNPMKTPEAALSFCSHIRQQVSGWQDPIIAVIWADEEKAIRSAFDAGATDIVTMPCHYVILHFRLRCAIRAHRVWSIPKVILAEKAPSPAPVKPVSSCPDAQPMEVPALTGTFSGFTGLPDKRTFEDLLRFAISSAKEQPLSVFFMEIDRLQSSVSPGKNAAEAIGPAFERGLQRFIGRMTSRYFPVGQLGPLQFSLMLLDVVTWSEVRRHALSIIDELTAAFSLDQNHKPVAIRIGVSVCPEDGHDAAVLLKKAELARYLAGEGGGNGGFHFYRPLCTDSSVYYDSLMIT